jgi:hypothetical protein
LHLGEPCLEALAEVINPLTNAAALLHKSTPAPYTVLSVSHARCGYIHTPLDCQLEILCAREQRGTHQRLRRHALLPPACAATALMLVAVHVGAGFHSRQLEQQYREGDLLRHLFTMCSGWPHATCQSLQIAVLVELSAMACAQPCGKRAAPAWRCWRQALIAWRQLPLPSPCWR